MDASAAISSLDREIAANGQEVTLVFVEIGSSSSLPCQAFVRGYQPQELIDGIVQGDTLVVVSSTSLASAPRLPRRNDHVNINGDPKRIENVPPPIYLQGRLVRLNLQVRGP